MPMDLGMSSTINSDYMHYTKELSLHLSVTTQHPDMNSRLTVLRQQVLR
jgi:hypothetical protein